MVFVATCCNRVPVHVSQTPCSQSLADVQVFSVQDLSFGDGVKLAMICLVTAVGKLHIKCTTSVW